MILQIDAEKRKATGPDKTVRVSTICICSKAHFLLTSLVCIHWLYSPNIHGLKVVLLADVCSGRNKSVKLTCPRNNLQLKFTCPPWLTIPHKRGMSHHVWFPTKWHFYWRRLIWIVCWQTMLGSIDRYCSHGSTKRVTWSVKDLTWLCLRMNGLTSQSLSWFILEVHASDFILMV